MAENKFTATDLKEMQQWPLDKKIGVTMTRITEFGMRYDEKLFVAFSGGKDSTVLLDLARKVYPDIPAVFVDTGLEYPEVKQFVKSHENVEIIRPKKTFRQVIEEFGYPIVSKKVAGYVATAKRNPNSARAKFLSGEYDSKIFGFGDGKWNFLVNAPFKVSDYCCDVMKKQPNHHYSKETGRYPLLGTLACESIARRNEWMRSGCNLFDSKKPTCKPLSFWTDEDIHEYISKYNVRIPKLYDMGYTRNGCMYCGFGVHLEPSDNNRYQRLKDTHPIQYSYFIKNFGDMMLDFEINVA